MTLDDITAQLLVREQSAQGIRTRTALLVVDVQNDFTSPFGRLPLTVPPDYLTNVRVAVQKTRESGGVVVWIRTEFKAPRQQHGEGGSIVLAQPQNEDAQDNTNTSALEEATGNVEFESINDIDGDREIIYLAPTPHFASFARIHPAVQSLTAENRHVSRAGRGCTSHATTAHSRVECTHLDPAADHFLSGQAGSNQILRPGSWGAESPVLTELGDPDIDLTLTKSEYSAFYQTPLLSYLRSRLVTTLRVAGCLTNVSILATCREAVRYGFAIHLLTDCLAFRVRLAHEKAMTILTGELGAQLEQSRSHDLLPSSQDDVASNDLEVAQLDGAYDSARDNDEYTTAQVLRQSINGAALGRQSPTTSVHARNGATNARPRPRSLLPQPVPRTPDALSSPATSKANRSRIPVLARMNSRSRLTPSPSSSPSPSSRFRTSLPYPNAEPFLSSVSVSASVPASPPSPARSQSSFEILSNYAETPPTTSAAPKSIDGDSNRASDESDTLYLEPSAAQAKFAAINESVPIDQVSPAILVNGGDGAPGIEGEHASAIRSKPLATVPSRRVRPRRSFLSDAPLLGPDQEIGEGDSRIYYDVPFQTAVGHNAVNDIFYQIKNEVKWQKMYHVTGEVPRLVCVQGDIQADGSMPVYRHPTDQTLPLLRFSSKVQRVKEVVEELVGHPMNHVLIQLYRRGQDYISEHSDKTLDIVHGSAIVNVSFGAMRKMRLRTKKSRHMADTADAASITSINTRQTQQIPMPHSSVFVLGPATNTAWLHGINQDKRAAADRSESERAYEGERISLTFRNIGTFLNHNSTLIWGQGASGKTQDAAHHVINGDETQTNAIIRAFGIENQSTTFDWDGVYGDGFDVLHFRKPSASEDAPLLFLSGSRVQNVACLIYLHELDEPFHFRVFGAPLEETGASYTPQLSFHDTDAQRTQVDGSVAILLYLDRFYPLASDMSPHRGQHAPMTQKHRSPGASSFPLLLAYHEWLRTEGESATQDTTSHLLHTLATHLSREEYLSGAAFGVADCAFWPIVDGIFDDEDISRDVSLQESELEDLREWHARVEKRAPVHEAVWGDAEE